MSHYIGDGCPGGHADELTADRVLTVQERSGPWTDYSGNEPAERSGSYWTVIDCDTGQQMGGFGFPIEEPTREEALSSAERLASKWGWLTEDAT